MWLCHTNTCTHTHNTYTHKKKQKRNIHLQFQIEHHRSAVLFCTQNVDRSTEEGETDRERDFPRLLNEKHCHILYFKMTITHLVTVWAKLTQCHCFVRPFPRWHLRSLPSTLSGSTPFSFFRPSVSEFWICCMR